MIRPGIGQPSMSSAGTSMTFSACQLPFCLLQWNMLEIRAAPTKPWVLVGSWCWTTSEPKGRTRAGALIEGRGCRLLFLRPYSSPDLLDLRSRRPSRRSGRAAGAGGGTNPREALIEAVDKALDAATTHDGRGSFEHCGYRLPAQPP